MCRVSLLFIMLCVFLCFAIVPASYGITMMWAPNIEEDLGGYKLYYGTSSRSYNTVIGVGNVTAYELDKLYMYENLPYFISLTAYDTSGNESSYSSELLLTLDDSIDYEDNCPDHYNPDQKDSYPPAGNDIGDACDCEGDFACDRDVDGFDVTLFQADMGRNRFTRPCTNDDPCNGDFDCDGDVDGWDNTLFKQDSGRNPFNRPCPLCVPGEWCRY